MILDVFPQDKKTVSKIQFSFLQKFEYNPNALKLRQHSLPKGINSHFCTKLKKYFVCTSSLQLSFDAHKENLRNDFQRSFYSLLEYW